MEEEISITTKPLRLPIDHNPLCITFLRKHTYVVLKLLKEYVPNGQNIRLRQLTKRNFANWAKCRADTLYKELNSYISNINQ